MVATGAITGRGVGYSIGSRIGGLFGGFVAGLLAIPTAGAIQTLAREARRTTVGHGKTMMAGIDQEAAGGPGTRRDVAGATTHLGRRSA